MEQGCVCRLVEGGGGGGGAQYGRRGASEGEGVWTRKLMES